MLLLGCLLAAGAALAPRLILVLAWIFSDRWAVVWSDQWVVPLLGILFLPYTTIMYVLVWTPAAGVSGRDWVWIGLGVVLGLLVLLANPVSLEGGPANYARLALIYSSAALPFFFSIVRGLPFRALKASAAAGSTRAAAATPRLARSMRGVTFANAGSARHLSASVTAAAKSPESRSG